jgi:hypothetical protein
MTRLPSSGGQALLGEVLRRVQNHPHPVCMPLLCPSPLDLGISLSDLGHFVFQFMAISAYRVAWCYSLP